MCANSGRIVGNDEDLLQRHLDTATHLDDLGREKMARRVRSCCRKGFVTRCECNPAKERRYYFVCDTRSCQPSSKRRFQRLESRYEVLIKEMKWPKFITLGYRATPLLELDGILSAFKRFRRLKKRERDPTTGKMSSRHVWTNRIGMVCIEAKWNEDHWWLHLHILADGPWILVEQLTKEWEMATGQTSANVDVKRAATKQMMRYLMGYTFKPMEASPEKEAVFLNAAYKKHFLTIFGLTSKEMKGLLLAKAMFPCRVCGSLFHFDGFIRPPSRPDMQISVTGPPSVSRLVKANGKGEPAEPLCER